jgi:hypothetical protein
MPIEIRELIVKAAVQNDQSDQSDKYKSPILKLFKETKFSIAP